MSNDLSFGAGVLSVLGTPPFGFGIAPFFGFTFVSSG